MTSSLKPGRAVPESPPDDIVYRHRVSFGRGARDVWASREILRSLVERQFRTRYKQAVLGVCWPIVTPLVLMVAFTFLFRRVGRVDTEGAPYQLFSYLGLLPWTFASGALTSATNSLTTQLALINKVFCPRELFPLSSVFLATIDTAFASLALVVLFAVHGVAPGMAALWLPVLVMVVMATVVGWALLIAVWTVYLRDIRHALPLLLQFGLFATPVAYGFEVIPRAVRPFYAVVNPLGPAIDGLRDTLLHNRAPDLPMLGWGSLGAAVVLVVAYYVFKRLEVGVVDVA